MFDIDDDASTAATTTNNLSRFEREQLKIQAQISQLESEAISEKPWALRGEVSSKVRPVNSLLEEDLEIETASRPAPVVTEETTASLEDLIKMRIRDSLFNDVERRIDTKRNNEFDPNRRPLIDESKSSKSLAEEYESEYLRQTTGGIKARTEKDLALEKEHAEIETLLGDLNASLDALSNWHFKPRPSMRDLEVSVEPTGVTALAMEEVIPAVVSDATAQAPQDVYVGPGVKKGEAEMDSADRKKERLRKKRLHKKQKVEREKAVKAKEAAGITVPATHSAIKQGKDRALDKLRKQSNVTIIGGDGDVDKLKGRQGKGGARIIKKGDTLGADKKGANRQSEMLRL